MGLGHNHRHHDIGVMYLEWVKDVVTFKLELGAKWDNES